MNGPKLHIYSADLSTVLELPYVDSGIKAGFPSPAQDYLTESIDLNRDIIKHRESTFYGRVDGDSMKDAGMGDGDIVVVDRALDARDGDYVVAYLDGDYTIKEFRKDKDGDFGWLVPHNDAYSPIKVTADNDFIIWGVVTFTIKKMYR